MVTYFVQECPTCGRSLEVKVEYLGKKLACLHCRGTFVAKDPSNQLRDTTILRRAERLLMLTAQHPHSHRPQESAAST
jgi:hypothetical protein